MATGIVENDGEKKLVVKIRIHQGFHLYAYVARGDPFIPVEVEIELPEGYKKEGKLNVPSYEYYNENGTTVYTGEIVFTQKISGNGGGKAVCYLTWQCCDAHVCQIPVIRKSYVTDL